MRVTRCVSWREAAREQLRLNSCAIAGPCGTQGIKHCTDWQNVALACRAPSDLSAASLQRAR